MSSDVSVDTAHAPTQAATPAADLAYEELVEYVEAGELETIHAGCGDGEAKRHLCPTCGDAYLTIHALSAHHQAHEVDLIERIYDVRHPDVFARLHREFGWSVPQIARRTPYRTDKPILRVIQDARAHQPGQGPQQNIESPSSPVDTSCAKNASQFCRWYDLHVDLTPVPDRSVDPIYLMRVAREYLDPETTYFDEWRTGDDGDNYQGEERWDDYSYYHEVSVDPCSQFRGRVGATEIFEAAGYPANYMTIEKLRAVMYSIGSWETESGGGQTTRWVNPNYVHLDTVRSLTQRRTEAAKHGGWDPDITAQREEWITHCADLDLGFAAMAEPMGISEHNVANVIRRADGLTLEGVEERRREARRQLARGWKFAHEVTGHSYADIARAWGLSAPTVRGRVRHLAADFEVPPASHIPGLDGDSDE